MWLSLIFINVDMDFTVWGTLFDDAYTLASLQDDEGRKENKKSTFTSCDLEWSKFAERKMTYFCCFIWCFEMRFLHYKNVNKQMN